MFIAYCYASGRIDFGDTVPEGTLPIVAGREREVRELIEGAARHGIGASKGLYLVPGVPENQDDEEKALDALIAWTTWLAKGKRDRPLLFGNSIPF